jgi:hypothetical protein
VRLGVRLGVAVSAWEIGLLLALVGLGAMVIGYELSDVPRGFWGDEGAFWLSARLYEPGDVLRDPFRPEVYGFPFAGTLAPSLSQSIFGPTVFAWRASTAVFVLLTIAPLYFLARSIFGRTAAFVSVVVFFSSPYLLAFGRMGYNNMQALPPLVLSALLGLAALQRRSAFLFFGAGVAAGLGFYAYPAARLAPFLLGALIFHAGMTRRFAWREAGIALALAAAGTVLAGFPPALSGLVEPGPEARKKLIEGLLLHERYVSIVFPDAPIASYRRIEWAQVPLVFDPLITLRLLARGVVRTMLAFHDPAIVQTQYIRGPLAGRWTSAFALAGVALGASRIRWPGPALLLVWTALALVLLSIVNSFPPQHAHMVVIIPVLAIWMGASVAALAEQVRRLPWPGAAATAAAVAAIAAAVFATLGVREYRAAADDFLGHAEMAMVWEAMDLEDGEYVLWVYTDPHYGVRTPVAISMFDLEERYRRVHVGRLLEDRFARERDGASVVVVGELRVPDEAMQELPLRVAQQAFPGWSVEQLKDTGIVIGWTLRPPREPRGR